MAGQFHSGQLVVMQNATIHFEFNGAPAVVIGGLAKRNALNVATGKRERINSYHVEVLNKPPRRFFAAPHQLRPLRDGPDVIESECDEVRALENT